MIPIRGYRKYKCPMCNFNSYDFNRMYLHFDKYRLTHDIHKYISKHYIEIYSAGEFHCPHCYKPF